MESLCLLCDRELWVDPTAPSSEDARLFKCTTCGSYWVSGQDRRSKVFSGADLRPFRHLLSAITKAAPEPIRIDRKRRTDLINGIPRERTVPEKIELTMRWFGAKSGELGDEIRTADQEDYPVAWCRSPEEWTMLLSHLTRDRGLLKVDSLNNSTSHISVTVPGWYWLEEQPKASGAKVFIAMSFDKSLMDVKDAIGRGIQQAGYDPVRVDDDEYTGGVMDRIVGHIRDSRFVVADFTKNRGGVYYEAGIAFGFGLQVVNLSAEECLDETSQERLHFDVRHLNFITWKREDLGSLSDQLRDRIVAIFGRGPLPAFEVRE